MNVNLHRTVQRRDTIFDVRDIAKGFKLIELRSGPKAHVARWVLVDANDRLYGEISRPRYGYRTAMVQADLHVATFRMQLPAGADQQLVEELVRFVELYL